MLSNKSFILWTVEVLIIYITTVAGQGSNSDPFRFPENQFSGQFRSPQVRTPLFFESQFDDFGSSFDTTARRVLPAQQLTTNRPSLPTSPTTTARSRIPQRRRPSWARSRQRRPRNRLRTAAVTFTNAPRLQPTIRQVQPTPSPPPQRVTRPTTTENIFSRFIAPNQFAAFPSVNEPRTETSFGTTRNPSFPSVQKILEIREETREFINQDAEWLPNLVQLVFHTCIGGCDGCLNFAEPDNKGLTDTYATVRRRWLTTEGRFLSLADFIVLLGTEAAEIGLSRSEETMSEEPRIPFEPGRITCNDPDNYNLHHRFPRGDDTDSVQYLIDEFGYEDRRLAIALLGAHSLGGCKIENMGFAGNWDKTPLVLDNHYYKSLTETSFWTAVPVSNTFQWNSSEPDGPVMLHADLALIHSFRVDENKRPSCARSMNCKMSKDSGRANIYAHSFSVWVRDFIPAFLQMVDKRPARQG